MTYQYTMKKFLRVTLLTGALISIFGSSTYASEMTVPGLSLPKAAPEIQPAMRFWGKLETSQFESSVEGAQNNWRAVLRQEGSGVRIGLKTGDWDRPDPQPVSSVWLVNNINWAKIDTRGKDIEYSYTFAQSTVGIQAIFKFGATLKSAVSPDGDCSFTLAYGEDGCTFRRGEASTSGTLPFKITTGTTVRIRIKENKSADIWIDDQPILADQPVDLKSNFVSFIAKSDSIKTPKILHLSSFQAKLVN
jgi:hypothetical protein